MESIATEAILHCTKHRVYCNGSGCTGYIIQDHVYTIESGNSCSACGYGG